MPDIELLRPYLPFPNIEKNNSLKNAVIHPFASKATHGLHFKPTYSITFVFLNGG